MTTLTHLECVRCGTRAHPAASVTRCACGGTLLARYDLEAAGKDWGNWRRNAPDSMWLYGPVLPVRDPSSIVSLGEGMTPLIQARRLGELLGAGNLWIKDEGANPTSSFEARGMSVAVSMAVELGIPCVGIQSSGEAAVALAAYAAAAGIEAHVVLPPGASQASYVQCRAHGARIGASIPEGVFDLSAFREPYRIEGSKTIACEIAEQTSWTLPDAIVFPMGEGLGLAGAWKAFDEMEGLGWIATARPRMIAVGSALVPPADTLVAEILDQNGGPVEVGRREAIDAALDLAATEGIFASPEGGAAIAALPGLFATGRLKRNQRIVVVNTASGLAHIETYATRFPRAASGEHDKLGGLITPR